LLFTLERALIAKLLLVTDELRVRSERLAEESKGLPDSGENRHCEPQAKQSSRGRAIRRRLDCFACGSQ